MDGALGTWTWGRERGGFARYLGGRRQVVGTALHVPKLARRCNRSIVTATTTVPTCYTSGCRLPAAIYRLTVYSIGLGT